MKKVIAIIALALLAGAYVLGGRHGVVTTQAQEDPSVAGRIERKLKEKESRFKFQPRRTGGKAVKQQWRSGKEYVTVTINEMESAEEATRTLKMMLGTVAAGVIVTERNLGDEAYFIGPSPQVIQHGARNVSLDIRVGHVLISIDATSEQAAKRFAKHMVDELTTKK